MLYNFDVFYILLGDDPMLYGSIEQNKQTNKRAKSHPMLDESVSQVELT